METILSTAMFWVAMTKAEAVSAQRTTIVSKREVSATAVVWVEVEVLVVAAVAAFQNFL